MKLDPEAFGRQMAEIVKAHVSPLLARIDALEKQKVETEEIVDKILALSSDDVVDRVLAKVPAPKNGENGRDGTDGVDGRPGRDGVDGKDGASGIDGKDGEPGRDGRDGVDGLNGDRGRDGVDGENGKDGAPGRDGRDGVDGIDGKDGATGFDGKDGSQGERGERGDPGATGAAGRDGSDGIDGVRGMDGTNGSDGKNGADGFGFDDLELVFDGERELGFSFVKGERVRDFSIQLCSMIYRGVWREGTYQRGDTVTWGGSMFVADRETTDKPETADSGWKLATKRGRDGKSISLQEILPKIEEAVKRQVNGLKTGE